MGKLEKNFLEFIEKHIFVIAFLGITLIGFLIRYEERGFESGDMTGCLLPWYEEIKSGGGLTALHSQVGNYNILYQLIIALFTYLPIRPVLLYKIVSCLFDIVCAVAGAGIVYEVTHDKGKMVMGYICIFVCPITFMNSALWGQCDAIYTSFLLLSVYFLLKEKYIGVFIAFALHLLLNYRQYFYYLFICFITSIKRNFLSIIFY